MRVAIIIASIALNIVLIGASMFHYSFFVGFFIFALACIGIYVISAVVVIQLLQGLL